MVNCLCVHAIYFGAYFLGCYATNEINRHTICDPERGQQFQFLRNTSPHHHNTHHHPDPIPSATPTRQKSCYNYNIYVILFPTLFDQPINQGLYSLSGKTSYRQISWSLEAARFACCNGRIALKFDRHIGSNAAEVPAQFQSDWKV